MKSISHSFASLPVLLRSLVLALVAAVSASNASAAIKSERLLVSILTHTPEATLVADGEQMKQAEAAANAIPGAQAFWGVGSSMEPLYAPETAIVVSQTKFSELKKGMTVLYMSRSGRMVAHALTGDVPKGWIAQGINNDREDNDLVTSENLIGVIVNAYSANHTEFRLELTKTLVAKGKLGMSLAKAE